MKRLTETRWATRSAARFSRAKLALLLFAASAGSTARAAPARHPSAELPTPVSVAQFEQFLSQTRHPKDAKFAAQLAGFELTERSGRARLAHWLVQFPGRRTRQALTALADLSAFEDLPPADLPSDPAPDPTTARQIFARVVDYVAQMRPKLPNFSALRSTTRFEIAPRDEILREVQAVRLFRSGAENAVYEPLGRASSGPGGGNWLFLAATSAMLVAYRDGREVPGSESKDRGQLAGPQPLLSTNGEFGPILTVVLRDALHGKVAWSHWEPGTGTPVAVFSYSVPQEASNYAVSDSAPDSSAGQATFPAYHGEIAVDPATGAILRIMLLADKTSTQVLESGIIVDYGPVQIAGRTYTCPVRSVALSRAPANPEGAPAQLHTFLNDTAFTNYHVFRSEVRIVP